MSRDPIQIWKSEFLSDLHHSETWKNSLEKLYIQLKSFDDNDVFTEPFSSPNQKNYFLKTVLPGSISSILDSKFPETDNIAVTDLYG